MQTVKLKILDSDACREYFLLKNTTRSKYISLQPLPGANMGRDTSYQGKRYTEDATSRTCRPVEMRTILYILLFSQFQDLEDTGLRGLGCQSSYIFERASSTAAVQSHAHKTTI